MLPSLSSPWGTKLQVLKPTVVEPAGISALRHALLELKEVAAVRVLDHTGRGDKIRYVLETTTGGQSNGVLHAIDEAGGDTTFSRGSITSSSASGETQQSGRDSLKSAIRTEKRLEEFIDLRNDVYYAARTAHRHEHCKFCKELTEYVIIVTPKPDSMTLRLLGEERAKRKLTQFVAGLLEVVVRHSSTEGREVCTGQMRIPKLLFEFLFTATATAEASEAA